MGLSDHIVSLIRTAVPAGVGGFLAWLAATTGVVVDDASTAGAVAFLGSLLTGLYYFAARLLEAKYPSLGWLLGAPRVPVYLRKADVD